MSGNASEWCFTQFDSTKRIPRGGSWGVWHDGWGLRLGLWWGNDPGTADFGSGLVSEQLYFCAYLY